jgi:hypothetical protein
LDRAYAALELTKLAIADAQRAAVAVAEAHANLVFSNESAAAVDAHVALCEACERIERQALKIEAALAEYDSGGPWRTNQ